MHSTAPPSSSSDQQEVKEDMEAHTTPAAAPTQHAHISFSDEQEEAAAGGGDGSSIKRVNSTHPSTTATMQHHGLPSRTETSKVEDGHPPPPQLSLMTSMHSVVSHVQDYIHHMCVLFF